MFGGTVPERGLSLKPPRSLNRFWGQTPGGVSPSRALRVWRDCPRTGTVPEAVPAPEPFLGTDPGGVSPSGALLMAEQLFVRDFPDLASGGADHDGTWRHVADDDRAGADEGLFPDLDPG